MVGQDKSRLDILEQLNDDTVLIVNDWAMNFLPQSCRESQQDWFTKRGISWHITLVFRRRRGEMQKKKFSLSYPFILFSLVVKVVPLWS